MLNNQVRILNFDNSITRQNEFIARFHPVIVQLQDIASCARLWLNRATEEKIKRLFFPQMRNTVTFLGSGDFHHISSLLLDQFSEPLSVIIFDTHPDWDTLPPRTGCGSWVSRILKKPNVEKVILFGISSNDISTFNIQTGNLAYFRDNRLKIYPYEHVPTKVWLRKIADNSSLGCEKKLFYTKINWQELKKQQDLTSFARRLIEGLEVKRVYVSIDKDCLKSAYSLTNWEEGLFELDDLLMMLKIIKEQTDIVGLDITGDFSSIDIKSKVKSFCSRLDHPQNFSAKDKPLALIDSVNGRTNIRIVEALGL